MKLCDEVFAETPAYGLEREWMASVCHDLVGVLAARRRGVYNEDFIDRLGRLLEGTVDPTDIDELRPPPGPYVEY